jgi:O-antigen/teichoic acid export membrane protein
MKGKQLIKSVWWALVEGVSLIFLSFVTFMVVARLLGPAAFGQASAVIAIVQLMGLFVGHLFAEVLVQRAEIRRIHVGSAFWTSLAIAAVFITGCVISLSFMANKEFGRLLCVASLGLVPEAYSGVQSAMLRREFKFRSLAVRTLAGRLAGALLALALAFGGAGAWSIIAQQVTTVTLSSAVLWYLAPPNIGWFFAIAKLRDLVGFAVTSLASELMLISTPKLYLLATTYFFTAQEFGYLSLGFRLVQTLRELIGHVSANVGLPVLSRLQDHKDELQRQFVWATSVVCLIAMPLFVGLAVCGSDVIRAISGETWLPAVPAMQILALGAAGGSASYLCSSLLSAYGRPGLGLLRGAVGLAVTLGLLPLAASHGLTGVALVWAFYSIVSSILAMYLCAHAVSVRMTSLLLSLVTPVMVAVGIGAALWLIDSLILSNLNSAVQRFVISASVGGCLLTFITLRRYGNLISLLVTQRAT